MATKKTTTRKTATRSTAKTSAAKVTPKAAGIKRIAREANPDAHVVTGKYRFLICFLMITTVIFAGISVCAISLAVSALNQSQEYEACYMEDKNCTLPNRARDKALEKKDSILDNRNIYIDEIEKFVCTFSKLHGYSLSLD